MDVQSLAERGNQQQAAAPPDGANGATAAAPAGESLLAQSQTRPDWLPESYFDAEKGETKWDDFGKHYSEIAAAHKIEADRLAAYPQKPEDLKIALPEGVKLPEGVTLDDKNPTYAKFRQWVFERKLDPAVAGEALGMYVQGQIADVEAINARVAEEERKLGTNGPARIAAVETALAGRIGKPLAAAVMSGVFRADQVEALEKVVLALANGASPQLSADRGGASEPAAPSITERWYPQQKAN